MNEGNQSTVVICVTEVELCQRGEPIYFLCVNYGENPMFIETAKSDNALDEIYLAFIINSK